VCELMAVGFRWSGLD